MMDMRELVLARTDELRREAEGRRLMNESRPEQPEREARLGGFGRGLGSAPVRAGLRVWGPEASSHQMFRPRPAKGGR
jgi:hypothetical protein